MVYSKSCNTSHKDKSIIKSYRTDLIVTSVPVTSTIVWILARPYYLAGWINSGDLLLMAEIIAALIIFSFFGGCIWLFFHLVAHLIYHRFERCLGCCVFVCIVFCTFLIFRLTTESRHFRFEHGFSQWVLKNADLQAIDDWRKALELDKSNYQLISEKNWSSSVVGLSPERITCTRLDSNNVELKLSWRGGLRRVYGITFRPKLEELYSPNWRGPVLKVAKGVYVWCF